MEMVVYKNNKITIKKEICEKIVSFAKEKARMDILEEELKENLKEKMEQYKIPSFENDFFKVIYKSGTTRTSVDSKKLKEEMPDIYDAYSKTSPVKSSISLSIK